MRYHTIGKFKSKTTDRIYFVKRDLKTGNFSCNCPGWIYRRHCKHVEYVKKNLPFVEITNLPSYQEAVKMDWGRNKIETQKWIEEHLKIIEI
jgi:hypothetical protein